ncbi:RNA-binding transcriptional accessory protein [Aerococcus agrisoli]|uniref:RNA-binding transcriptional accessory protein n=1 Tax=Aerococcus agrisoli TaxID=2487350 RepID=A0A3N4GID8_9LACT|nr:Tex family protein [Aerococcus agrisoli]RPA58921.1 RNA-binding transcriptional accessory protein [Aerococcus agrisoli]
MESSYIQIINKQLPFTQKQIESVLSLLEEGNTVPFIARYRKEATQSLDEVAIRDIDHAYQYTKQLEERKVSVLSTIEEQGKLTKELADKIKKATVLQTVEDLYAPYKQKRRTKATIAKENGLEGLAEWLFSSPTTGNVLEEASKYLNEDIADTDAALAGAHEIMAEWISEDADIRAWMRKYTLREGNVVSVKRKNAEDDKAVFEIYYDFSQNIANIKPYQVLAMNRGEKLKILNVSVESDEFPIIKHLVNKFIKGRPVSTREIQAAIQDALDRFLKPSIEREIRSSLTETAEKHAIDTFAENLGHLLMQPPLQGRTVLGLDPAFRTGCKLAIVDATGKVLAKDVIYPHAPVNKKEEAARKFNQLVADYNVEMVAIGNGTASRESELFVAEQIQENNLDLVYSIVNEAGASVYSASDIAREEFPDFNVEERSAVSIARRLQDPLAELVKIDPKAIGVGQYQHDVSQKELAETLDFTVETAVNRVGVNLNTASASLLSHVAGLSMAVAKNVVAYRNENGIFTNRKQLAKVKRLGPKTYEQAVGFIRIPEGDNILDNTGIHPENYATVTAILKELDIAVEDIQAEENRSKIAELDLDRLSAQFEIGKETLVDIQKSLLTPGRDPREDVEAPILRSDVLTLKDLKIGMQLQGTVRNVVDFGAFVDVGVKQDGLVHISRMSKKFVSNPADIVSVGDIVDVWVSEIDEQKGRIGLSMLPIAN